MLKVGCDVLEEYNTIQYNSKTSLSVYVKTELYRVLVEPFVRHKNAAKELRYLEIGPGEMRINGFETLNLIKSPVTDYIGDATKKIPFKDETFDIVYASHVLEHCPWYLLDFTLNEWRRVIKKGGAIEIWVPDGLKILRAYVDAEINGSVEFYNDGWFRFNPEKNPTLWVSGRVFSYGDGLGTRGHHNWHLSLFSYAFLTDLLFKAGFEDVTRLSSSDCRGYDHGWINLGMRAVKK